VFVVLPSPPPPPPPPLLLLLFVHCCHRVVLLLLDVVADRDPGQLFQPTSAYTTPKSLPLLTAQAVAGQSVASRDNMLPRGEEHAKFLSSMQT
jgi:hypothetical protein